ncbi:MAG TPA: type II toxin-antitoxin system VapC family toxin [Deltaproteobacteria bacterium]|nr:type II toxin-antitoxin system VapC family toxin [Deltaproteobacteria bacterium]
MKILLDTHIWIWYLSGSDRLPKRYRESLNLDNNQIWLSPISVWETLVLAEKGKLSLRPEPISWIQQSLKRWPIKEAPLNIQVSIRSRQLDLPHQDPADRFISATALIYDLTLMTIDERLISAPWLPTLAN